MLQVPNKLKRIMRRDYLRVPIGYGGVEVHAFPEGGLARSTLTSWLPMSALPGADQLQRLR